MTTATQRNQQIRALYERERDRLFRAALRVGGGRRAFAEDVVHDVFVKVLTSYESLDDSRDLGGYLYRCTMNGCVSRLRKEAVRNNPLVALLLGSQMAPGPGADARARLNGVQREAIDALGLLPGRERVAFCMVRLDDAPLADDAQVLSCSVPTACTLVQRAEAILGRAGWGASSSASVSVAADKAVAHG